METQSLRGIDQSNVGVLSDLPPTPLVQIEHKSFGQNAQEYDTYIQYIL